MEELYQEFQSLARVLLAPYRRQARLYEELEADLYVIFHHLLMEYDDIRGASFATYVTHALPLALLTAARREMRIIGREEHFSNLSRPDEEGSAYTGGGEETLADLVSQGALWIVRDRNVEESIVGKLTVEELLAALPKPRREVARLRLEGIEFDEIAERLQKTEGACRQLWKRACVTLRGKLAQEM